MVFEKRLDIMLETVHSRRLFLQRGMALLAATPTIPLFLDQTASAMVAEDPLRTNQNSGTDGKILVIVQLSGGNDGLNTVVPYADDAYHRARPTLAKPADSVLKINDYVGLHPNLAPLKSLYDNGMMSVIQGVGYPNPNRSHFRSMDIWHTAEPDNERTTSGWLGRFFDSSCAGIDPKNTDASLGVAIGETQPLAMRGEKYLPLSFEKPGEFRYKGSGKDGYLELNQPVDGPAAPVKPAGRKPAIQVATQDEQLDFLSRTALDAQASSDRIIKAAAAHKPSVEYPRGEFGESLRTVAAMIASALPTRVYYVTLGGFDTHANQQGRHDGLMQTFAQGIDAFMKDLKHTENDERVMVMTFSEFGRRVSQNASQGTDHGAAAPAFLFGKRLRHGMIGKHPSLTDLDSGDLKFAVDFRNIYASILQDWLDTPSKPILGKQFATADLVKG
jgi:uncharacterized protein (DUF1501 family)